MGSLFKKTVTRPLPPGAEIITRQGERLARWRDEKRKMRTAPVTTGQNGADRIREESGTYVGRYRDGSGLVVEVSTGSGTRQRLRVCSPTWSDKPRRCGPGC